MLLTDGRITLRTPIADDAPAVAAAVQDSLEILQPWMPWATDSYSEFDALQWINRELEPSMVPMVILGPDDALVGTTGLNGFDKLNDRANLGYWLRADATGFGYATAATRLVAGYGLEQAELHRVEIMMSVENEPSRKVAERVGAAYEGVQRGRLWLQGRYHDAHCYAFIAGDRIGP